ncbi:hypothetical protein [Bdellovibrio sp. NC01]|uniref:hypothetical protein n=1 Tax=Bdellovibrio sp. NC01 TaxID=2220073 RepID=UPI00115B8329|nr:hypothetical protein [Bdellovibrio sp. NC01]QDK36605.1 hypothetical protein DOE51_02815 [Bdellovibrio sp. NC01]
MNKALLALSFFLLSAQAHAGTSTGTIAVSLTIVEQAQMASTLSSNSADYQGATALHVLTNATDGQAVDIYLNGAKVASTRSNNGVVVVTMNEKLANAKNVDLSFRSGGKNLQVLQSAVERGNNLIPKMTLDPQVRQVQIGNRTVGIQSVVVEF